MKSISTPWAYRIGVRESQDRVRSALRNCGYDVPPTHITVNLTPAEIRKEGSGFDLPMALGILGAYGGLNKRNCSTAYSSGNCPWTAEFGESAAPCPLRSRPGAKN